MEVSFRVNYEYLKEHIGEKVTIVGKITYKGADGFEITTTDNKTGSIKDSTIHDVGTYVEITGKCITSDSIEPEVVIPLNDAIDHSAFNKMVVLMHKHKEIF